jgi:hypothetical protein
MAKFFSFQHCWVHSFAEWLKSRSQSYGAPAFKHQATNSTLCVKQRTELHVAGVTTPDRYSCNNGVFAPAPMVNKDGPLVRVLA